jgi:hypothetical protein
MTSHQIDKTKVIILEHRDRLSKIMARFITNLVNRSAIHDDSKLSAHELGPYASVIDEFGKYKFGTPEYGAIRETIQGSVDHHYAHNRHHPEHFENGINDMNLIDILEMIADWKSATQNTGGNGDIMKSIEILSKKYGIAPQLVHILVNTVNDFGLK